MAKENGRAAGYVVQRAGNLGGKHFLSRSGRFVRHSNRNGFPGISRAWIHNEQTLLKGGDWDERAGLVFPAKFNPDTNKTEITGSAVSFEYFQDSAGGRIGLEGF